MVVSILVAAVLGGLTVVFCRIHVGENEVPGFLLKVSDHPEVAGVRMLPH